MSIKNDSFNLIDKVLAVPSIPCLQCKEQGIDYRVHVLTLAHLDKHNMTKEEYLAKFPKQAKNEYWGTLYMDQNRKKKRAEKNAG